MVLEFKVEGGCKLKENLMVDFWEVWIIMVNGCYIFKVMWFKIGGKICY